MKTKLLKKIRKFVYRSIDEHQLNILKCCSKEIQLQTTDELIRLNWNIIKKRYEKH